MSSNIVNTQGQADSQHELDLARLLGELIDHRVAILGITLIFALFGTLYALFASPVYLADAMVQIENKQQNSILKTLNQLTPALSPDSSAEIQILKSRMILGETVEALRLRDEITQVRLPLIGKAWAKLTGQPDGTLILDNLTLPETAGEPIILTLTAEVKGRFLLEGEGISAHGTVGRPLQHGGVSITVRELSAPPGTQFRVRQRGPLEVINALSRQFSVTEQGKESGILMLSLTGYDPVQIKNTLNHIMHNYLQQNIARQAAQDSQSLVFLQRQLPLVRQELEQAEERLNTYRKQRDSVDLTLEAKSVLEQIVNVDNQLNELTFREAEVSQHFKKDHPTYRALREKRQTLESERERLNKRVETMPSTQQQVLRLSRDVDTNRAVYLQLLTRQQELNISRSSTIGNARIIDSAATNPGPIKPRKALIVAFMTLFGFFISAAGVLAKAALRRGINAPEQLEKEGINVYATLPHSVWLHSKTRVGNRYFFHCSRRHKIKDVPFLPVDRPLDNFVEAVRGLRTSLHFAMMDAVNNILMFSGPTQDCGKTLVSTSLAALVTQVDKRVLFIDADMRKGYVHNIFGLRNDAGLSDVLSGKVTFQAAIQTYTSGQFDVVTCGQYPPNPSELLTHDRFREFMTWASEQYDIVIVDAPPVLAVTDAALVGRIAGSTLLVARFNVTSVREMEVSQHRLQQMGVNIKGAILNDVVKSAASYYASGYNAYGYSAGQHENEKSKAR
ncbi:polysaccharide biosynthesis tyrosine autokinase [Leclercia adecarboxylata]|uniref:polysaccharide biosynthesis tyrosine autokinase n=1 Tax=Leclercia TaxID=83654 RepID=UPI001BDC2EB9|nr:MULTISPECIES: polysaccharide biosynthesis tyrosine autokinase [Leclercia]MCZ7838319.1 polysaccharide biosynthesis tyrosine autokinase [Leclercia adecarboxylata]QVV60765.1 polysaccharide biosynthesis tyrosine autokinase [Leclercia sp. Colony189]